MQKGARGDVEFPSPLGGDWVRLKPRRLGAGKRADFRRSGELASVEVSLIEVPPNSGESGTQTVGLGESG